MTRHPAEELGPGRDARGVWRRPVRRSRPRRGGTGAAGDERARQEGRGPAAGDDGRGRGQNGAAGTTGAAGTVPAWAGDDGARPGRPARRRHGRGGGRRARPGTTGTSGHGARADGPGAAGGDGRRGNGRQLRRRHGHGPSVHHQRRPRGGDQPGRRTITIECDVEEQGDRLRRRPGELRRHASTAANAHKPGYEPVDDARGVLDLRDGRSPGSAVQMCHPYCYQGKPHDRRQLSARPTDAGLRGEVLFAFPAQPSRRSSPPGGPRGASAGILPRRAPTSRPAPWSMRRCC